MHRQQDHGGIEMDPETSAGPFGLEKKFLLNNIKTGRGTKHKRLINMENKQRVTGGVWERGMA